MTIESIGLDAESSKSRKEFTMSKSMLDVARELIDNGAYVALVFRYHRAGITSEQAKVLARETIERYTA